VNAAPALVCAALEVALNRYLALDADALQECARQQGRTIALEAELPPWRFCIELIPTGVRVFSDVETAADVSVRGRPATLLRLAWQVGQGESGIPQGLQIEGDTELLQRFNRTLARVGFDPEELLAAYLGDAAAHRVAQGLKTFFGWGRRTAGTLALDTAEYLREETGDLARAADVADWMDAVDRLRDGVDRLEARLARLQGRTQTASTP
jgi:ubiquinone biosynthesis protein UbiJ